MTKTKRTKSPRAKTIHKPTASEINSAIESAESSVIGLGSRAKELLKNRKVQMALGAVALHLARKMVKSRRASHHSKLSTAVTLLTEAKVYQLVEKFLKEKLNK